MGKIIALDVGKVRIGIAQSDSMQIIASPYENYTRKNITEDIAHINDIVISCGAEKIIVGLPVSMDGSSNAQSEYTEHFTDMLKNVVTVPVEYVDERFSSISAERLLINADVKRKDRKKSIDKIAAAIFLQSYLDRNKNKQGE